MLNLASSLSSIYEAIEIFEIAFGSIKEPCIYRLTEFHKFFRTLNIANAPRSFAIMNLELERGEK